MCFMVAEAPPLPASEITAAEFALITPRTTYGPYRTKAWEIVWVMSGRATLTSEGRSWSLVPGVVHLTPPHTTNFWEWDPDETIREGCVQFRSVGSADWPRNRAFAPDDVVPVLLRHILWLTAETPAGWEEARHEALRYALRAYTSGYSGTDPAGRAPLPEPMERVVSHVQRLWDRPPLVVPSLDELAAIGGVTKRHLCRLFERKIGMGPIAAFRLLRVARAAMLLEQTNLSVGKVAHLTGFSNEFHFSRVFRSVAGVPPTVFRGDPGSRVDLPALVATLAIRMWHEDEWER